MRKLLIISSFITGSTTLVMEPVVEVVKLLPKTGYENNFNLKDFDDIQVDNNEMIKGVDVSSYAEVLEDYLFQNNLFKSSSSDSSIVKYTYKDFETEHMNGTDQTIQSYLDNNVYSYINENGQKKYDNIFTILKSKGVNSIRLRLWVDPYDENGNSYGGGHNDIDTDIYIIKDAIKHGITNYAIDFHYSDFWADPQRQYIPKSWQNLSTSELEDKVSTYTYDTIEKIYSETSTLPYSVQIGNEITNGLMWKDNDKNNFSDAEKYLISGCKAVLKAQNDILSRTDCEHDKDYNIKKIIHIESPGKNKYYNALNNYLTNKELYDLIDIVGITFYPSWQGTPEKLFSCLRELNQKFPDKEFQIMEFSLPYVLDNSGNLGDEPSVSTYGGYDTIFPCSTADDQTVLMYDYLLAMSRALPDKSIGFYWWEPSWLNVGGTTWATEPGIEYASNYDEDTIKNNTTHDTWSNQGLFDRNGMLLPSADIINDFDRIKSNGNSINSINNDQFNYYDPKNFLTHKISYYNNGLSFNKSDLINEEKIALSTSYKKRNISSYMYDSKGIWNDQLFVYTSNSNLKVTNDEIIKALHSQYQHIMFSQVNVAINRNDSKIYINTSDKSMYYTGAQEISLNIVAYTSDNITFKNSFSIDKKDEEWEKKLFNFISEQSEYNDEMFWNYLDIKGGISDGKPWLYDNNKKANRSTEYYFLSDGNVRYSNIDTQSVTQSSKALANYDLVNANKKDWPDNIGEVVKNNKFYFAISKKTDNDTFINYGVESWQKIGLIVFEINIK